MPELIDICGTSMSKRKRDAANSLPCEPWWRDRLNEILEDDANEWTKASLARALGTSKTTITAICERTHASTLVEPISDLLCDYGLRPPRVTEPLDEKRRSLIDLISDLSEEDVDVLRSMTDRMFRKH